MYEWRAALKRLFGFARSLAVLAAVTAMVLAFAPRAADGSLQLGWAFGGGLVGGLVVFLLVWGNDWRVDRARGNAARLRTALCDLQRMADPRWVRFENVPLRVAIENLYRRIGVALDGCDDYYPQVYRPHANDDELCSHAEPREESVIGEWKAVVIGVPEPVSVWIEREGEGNQVRASYTLNDVKVSEVYDDPWQAVRIMVARWAHESGLGFAVVRELVPPGDVPGGRWFLW